MLKKEHLSIAFNLATTAAALAAPAGCGGDEPSVNTSSKSASSSSSSSGGGGEGGDSSSSSSSSSGAGGADACPSQEGTVLAVRTLYFGEGNSGEWKKVGFNIDGKVSTEKSTDLCKPSSGGSTQTAYPDGDDGIDNSFGKNLLPTILTLYPTWPQDVNNGISNGNFTALLKLMCLPLTGDVPVLTTKLFGGTKLPAGMPKWDGTDTWPVEPGLLNDAMDPESSSILFPNSSVIGMKFDAGKDGQVILSIPVKTANDSTSMKLTLYSARMTMDLAADHKSSTNGMIGGVLNTEEFIAEVKKIGALLKLCGNPLFDNLITQVRQASDILSDGTQDPDKVCDGITMGLGFEMQAAQRGDVGPSNPVGMACQ